MAKRTYIFFIFWLVTGNIFSQDPSRSADSLYHEWQHNENDTLKMHALFWLIDLNISNQNIDSAYSLALKARDFALKNQFKYSLAYSYEYLGQLSHLKSNYDSALHYDLLCLRKYTELNDSTGIAITLNSIGEDYLEREFYSQAYNYYYKSLNYAQAINDSLTIAIATYNLGRVLKKQGHYERALLFIDSSLQMSKKIGDEEGIAYSHFDIGEIYLYLGRHEESLDKLNSALEMSQVHSSFELIPQIYNKLGYLNHASNKNEEAVANFEQGLNYNKRLNSKLGIGESYHGLGMVFTAVGEYNKAEEYLKECLTIAEEIKSSDLQSKCYLELSKLFESKGQVQKALDYFKQYKWAQDTLFNSMKSEQLAQLQMQHVTQQQDLEISLLNQRQNQQQAEIKQEEFIRNVLAVIVAFFLILLLTLYRNSRRRRRMNNLLIAQQQELEQQRSELIELNKVKDKFFSIISHDLRSPINNLAGMSALLTKGNLNQQETVGISTSIQKQLKHASKLLDNLMDWVLLQSNEIKIRKENINLRSIIEENIEYFNEINDKQIELKNQVEDVEVLADKNMLELIIRNLVSNAIKFTDKNGLITINNEINNNSVIVSVSDNGIGVPERVKQNLFEFNNHYSRKGTANEKGTGLGLKLCKEFVLRNGGEIWVESEEGQGSTFKFTLQKTA